MSKAEPSDPLFQNYLDRVTDVLVAPGSTEVIDRTITPLSESLADLRATIRFHNRSYVSVWMRVRPSRDTLLLQRYAFHYMTADRITVFRYDNSDYHPGGEHAPHHKHIGENERVIDCPQPTVGQIRDEITAYLSEESCQ